MYGFSFAFRRDKIAQSAVRKAMRILQHTFISDVMQNTRK